MSGLKNFSSVLTAVMLLIFTTMVVISSGYPGGARFMPYVVGIPGMIFCIVQLVLDWRKTTLAPVRAGQGGIPEATEPLRVETLEEGEASVGRELLIWAYFVGFVALLLALGFYVAVPVLLLTFLHFEGKISWMVALLSAVGSTLVLYGAFALLLRLPLYAGFYGPAALDLLGL